MNNVVSEHLCEEIICNILRISLAFLTTSTKKKKSESTLQIGQL